MSFTRTNKGSISEELFYYIRGLLPEGGTILELGSGEGTRELAKYYKMISIEHNKDWVDKYNSLYYHAPLVGGWYDPTVVAAAAAEDYDLILIDGPPACGPGIRQSRQGFLRNIELFNTKVPIIFDDTDRKDDLVHMTLVAKKLKRESELIDCSDGKQFGVLL